MKLCLKVFEVPQKVNREMAIAKLMIEEFNLENLQVVSIHSKTLLPLKEK